MEDEGEAAQPGGGQRRTTHTHRDTTNNQGQAQHNQQDARAFEMPRGGARNGKLWACGNARGREKKKREPESGSESEAESEAATEREEMRLCAGGCVRARWRVRRASVREAGHQKVWARGGVCQAVMHRTRGWVSRSRRRAAACSTTSATTTTTAVPNMERYVMHCTQPHRQRVKNSVLCRALD